MAFEKSTIVRAMKLGFWTLERVAPGPGSVIAERLWCAIPSSRPVKAIKAGEIFKVRYDGRDVVAESWGEGPIVYLMHGWGGRRAQLDDFVQPLLWAGFRVVAVDAPSHGDSDPGRFGPKRGLLTEFSGALEAVVSVVGPAHGIVAHSLGATAVTLAILDGLKADRVVLISPMADPLPYTREFARWLGFGERIRTGFLRRLERRVRRPMTDFELPRRLGTVTRELPSALVIHDLEDRQTSPADGKELAAAWPEAEFVATQGLRHARILRDPGVVDRVTAHFVPVKAV